MRLYHGTNVEFETIDLAKSRPNKDFGQGFYLSDNYSQAEKMAVVKVEQQKFGRPFVITYDIDDNVFNLLKVKRFDDYSSEWAEFILSNRNNETDIPVHDYDIVIGPIANDRVGVQLWRYENEMIDLDTLVKSLKYMKGMTIQYFFGTQNAINYLKKV
ncbi:MAG: DUF3990 domain-containing protein [Bacteroidales bacterium]|nr:DUF3990 domain-containing protein [Bacteroidales bacterium]